MRVTTVVLMALMIDAFVLFGVPYMLFDSPQPLGNSPIGAFVAGDMSHPDELTMQEDNATKWVNWDTNIPVVSEILGGIIGLSSLISLFIEFGRLIISMVTFPFDLFKVYGLPAMWAVLIGVIYYAINITAAIQLGSGRQT